MKIGNKIKIIREIETVRGTIKNQRELAHKMDIDVRTLRNYEQNKTVPSFEMMMKFCRVLNLNSNIFLTDEHFRIYSRRKIIKDDIEVRRGVSLIFSGLGMGNVIDDKYLSQITLCPAFKDFFKYMHPNTTHTERLDLPFLSLLIENTESLLISYNRLNSLILLLEEKIGNIKQIECGLKKLSNTCEMCAIIKILEKNKNFTYLKNKELTTCIDIISKRLSSIDKAKSISIKLDFPTLLTRSSEIPSTFTQLQKDVLTNQRKYSLLIDKLKKEPKY